MIITAEFFKRKGSFGVQAVYVRFVLLLAMQLLIFETRAQPRIDDLRCEYSKQPIAIDVSRPRFSWKMFDSKRGARQQAYRLMVATDSIELLHGRANVWHSKLMRSSVSNAVSYGGVKLQSQSKYFWRVAVVNQDGRLLQSNISFFETANFSITDWHGQWISDRNETDTALKPAPLLRKTFTLKKKVLSARAYICGLGYYELSINGHKIGDHMLDPGYTNYNKTALYVKYDVTAALKDTNCIGVTLGNGWFNMQSRAVWYFNKAPWRSSPKVIVNLHINYADGTTDEIVTDQTWSAATGPVIFNSLYSGEYVDNRLVKHGWDTYAYQEDASWRKAVIRDPVCSELKSQIMPAIRVQQILRPVKFKQLNDTTFFYDFGQNFAGIPSLSLNGTAGTVLTLKHGEVLDESGRLNNKQIGRHLRLAEPGEAVQTDKVILKGGRQEFFSPRFTYHGFRYVEVTASKPVALNKESLSAKVMYTDVPRTGSFKCSNELLNRIYRAGLWTYTSNLQSIPTDCPQREKNGWTGDGHLACEIGMYNYDAILLYEKWIADFADEQRANGALPGIIPTSGWGYNNYGPAWDSALILIPWYIYQYYGDASLVKKYYPRFKLYVDYLKFRSDHNIVSIGLGDWIPFKTLTPTELTSTAYFYTDAVIIAKFAKLMGYHDDEKNYAELASDIKRDFNRKFYRSDSHTYANGSQTALSAALFQGLVPTGAIKEVTVALQTTVAKANDHLDVGLLGSKYLLNALSDHGAAETAYTVASQNSYPSWGWWLEKGETTFQESWDFNEKSTRNHIMYGEIVAWFSKALVGIKPDETSPGFKNILLAPNFIKDLQFAGGTLETIYGTVASEWKKTDAGIRYHVVIPANATATMLLPTTSGQKIYLDGAVLTNENPYIKGGNVINDKKTYHLQSGQYNFLIK